MPLTRATVTAASRIMLPCYPALAAWIGLAYLFGDPSRTNTPSFQVARDLMPMRGWGCVFLAIAVLLLVGYALRSRDVTVFVLSMATVAYLMWAAFFVWALLTAPDASLVAPAWPLFSALACTASATSIARLEGDTGGR